MGLDIRVPTGAMFTVLGILLLIAGALADAASIAHSLGININLLWGVVMLIFGATMMGFGLRAQRQKQ